VLAGGLNQPVGNQDEGAVGEGDTFGSAQMGIQDGPEAQVIEQGADGQDRSPGRGIEDVELLGRVAGDGRFLAEQPLELWEHFSQEIFAAELGDGVLLDLSVETLGLDDPDIFVDRALGGPNFDSAEVHAVNYHDRNQGNQGENPGDFGNLRDGLSPHFSARGARASRQTQENKGFPRARFRAEGLVTPNMG
jgi:hypothetical protein